MILSAHKVLIFKISLLMLSQPRMLTLKSPLTTIKLRLAPPYHNTYSTTAWQESRSLSNWSLFSKKFSRKFSPQAPAKYKQLLPPRPSITLSRLLIKNRTKLMLLISLLLSKTLLELKPQTEDSIFTKVLMCYKRFIIL